MDLLSTWRALYTLRYCPVTLIQTAFSAGTVFLLVAIHASSGTRPAHKELRTSLDQKTLVQQYLQDIGVSWNCATKISGTLEILMNEHVRPLLGNLNRKSPTTASLHISADIGDDEEEKGPSRSRSTSRKRSSGTTTTPQISHPHTISSGSGQSSLSTPPEHILTSSSPTQVPPPANPLISPAITISSACDPSHAAPSAPTAIPSLRSTSSSNPSNFADSWAHQPSLGSSPSFNYSSFAQRDFRNYAQPFSNYMDNPFSGKGNGSSDDVGHSYGGPGSLARNFQPLSGPSSENHHDGGYPGMSMLGQSLSEAPYYGLVVFSEVEDAHSHDFLYGAPFGTGFPNHESSSSIREHVPSSSHGDNDNMDLDNEPWVRSFN